MKMGVSNEGLSVHDLPIVTVSITTDAGRTDAELAARKHNRLIGPQGIRNRRKRHETGPKQQD